MIGRPTRPPYVADTDALYRTRWNKGWSLRRLALEACVSLDTVRATEAGRIPTFETQAKIARALGGDPSDFWSLDAAVA